MATVSSSLGTRIRTTIQVALLVVWSATVLVFTSLNLINAHGSLFGSIASISLLTYLVCRLLVALQPGNSKGSIAHFLTTAHRRSRHEALVMLLFSCSWLYDLLSKAFVMFFMTILGGVIATAIYNDELKEMTNSYQDNPEPETAALAEINEFKEKAGVDPRDIFKWIPPKALVYLVVLLWANFGILYLYMIRLAWKSIRSVFGAPRT